MPNRNHGRVVSRELTHEIWVTLRPDDQRRLVEHPVRVGQSRGTPRGARHEAFRTGAGHAEAAAALQTAVQANHFDVMQAHNLKETMAKNGVEFARECLIFEVCQPQQAKKALDRNMSISAALPFRISIYEEGGKTILATLKPTTLLAIFNVPQLEQVAQEVEQTIMKIINEAAAG